MTRALLLAGLLLPALLLCQRALCQHSKLDALFAKSDTTAVMDSLMKEMDAYFDSLAKPKSFLTAAVGLGNRTFSVKNNALNTEEADTRQLSVTPSLTYFHKSGLGISAEGFAANLAGNYRFYQYAITPSYDFSNKKMAAGISYTRYFGKDTGTLNASPYDDDFFGYANIRHKSWRYGLSLGYASGKFADKIRYEDSVRRFNVLQQRYEWVHFAKTVSSNNRIKDLSVSASVRKDIEWFGILGNTDNLLLSFSGYLVAGASRLHTGSQVNLALKNFTLARVKRNYENADGTGFQLQSAAAAVSVFYNFSRFSIQPVWFIDYYFQDTEQKFTNVFSVMLSYSL